MSREPPTSEMLASHFSKRLARRPRRSVGSSSADALQNASNAAFSASRSGFLPVAAIANAMVMAPSTDRSATATIAAVAHVTIAASPIVSAALSAVALIADVPAPLVILIVSLSAGGRRAHQRQGHRPNEDLVHGSLLDGVRDAAPQPRPTDVSAH